MVREIDIAQLDALIGQGVELIDVREKDELSEGELIPGAKHWPLSTFAQRSQELSSGQPTLFYCRSGMASSKAAEIAEHWSKQPQYFLSGGYLRYREKQREEKLQAI